MPTPDAPTLSPFAQRLEAAINAFCSRKWTERKLSYRWDSLDEAELLALVLTWLDKELDTDHVT
jgi:hypothetical protein